MSKSFCYILLLCSSLAASTAWSQTAPRKFTFTGAARGYFLGDQLDQDVVTEDTVTVPRLNSGHIMADLGLNIRPNKNMEIHGMVRVRNDYGGFWGSGVTFDIRQMYVKGVIGGVVRYQLGDINYRLTRYTFWNNDQEFFAQSPTVFKQQFDVVNYDHFHNFDGAWRQQGGAAEWGLVFKSLIEEIEFHTFATRIRASNNSTINDRIFAGGNVQLVQSKHLQLGWNYVNLSDIEGTSRNQSLFRNPVSTFIAKVMWDNNRFDTKAEAEWGRSRTRFINEDEAPNNSGRFAEVLARVSDKKSGWYVQGTAKRVESEFRSPGAQTKRINFGAQPVAFQRIGNEQNLRSLTMLDLMRESSLYNMQLQPYLMAFLPKYDNITPFGDATPNRQGAIVEVGWKAKKDVTFVVEQSMLSETRGEGTPEARQFSRTRLHAKWMRDKISDKINRRAVVELSARRDETKRGGTEFYKGVDLNTTVASVGVELEVYEKLDILAGWQFVEYDGFDYTAVRNNYAEIFNFEEYEVRGKETMTAAGLRYRFSDKSFLSAQMNFFHFDDADLTTHHYNVRQLMLLYQINF
jgi:hypothetical protein